MTPPSLALHFPLISGFLERDVFAAGRLFSWKKWRSGRSGAKSHHRGVHPLFPAVLFRRYSEDRNAGTVMVTSNVYGDSRLTQCKSSWSPEPRVLLPFFFSLSLSPLFVRPATASSLLPSFPKRRARVFNLVSLSVSRRVRVHATYVPEPRTRRQSITSSRSRRHARFCPLMLICS